MEIELFFLNGVRKGSTTLLPEMGESRHAVESVLEDEAFIVKFKSNDFFKKVILRLHENEIDYTECKFSEEDNKWEYLWIPKKLYYNQFECFFHNYFGIAELFLLLSNERDDETVILFSHIDVHAKKINADRVDGMLTFLAKHNSDALCSFFRVTRKNAGYKQGDTPADIYLEWIESNANVVVNLIDRIIDEPITKLTSTYRLIQSSESSNIDDQTLSWICDNLEDLYETDDERLAILNHENKFYSISKVRENVIINDTNVYENQVIHGFVATLKVAASNLLAGYDSAPAFRGAQTINEQYFSFFNQIKKFQKKINFNKIKKCNEIILRLGLAQKKLNKKLKVKRQAFGLPTLTMKVKNNKSYLSFFNKIISWYRFGSPDWSVQEELLSIQSIPKLFEYYMLFYIKEKVDNLLDFSSNMSPLMIEGTFDYNLGDSVFSIKYEPKYWMSRHSEARNASLVNTEGWTIRNKKPVQRGHFGSNSNRCPDYVFSMKTPKGNFYYILDAKYTLPEKAFTTYLPELTLKYLHGLYDPQVRSEPLGLTILCPDEKCEVKHFHSDMFNILSNSPQLPTLSVAAIEPGSEFEGNIDFGNLISSIINLIIDKSGVAIDTSRLKLSA